jgi:CBS domain-containing protein
MGSIDLDNLEPAQKLAKNYEVKHVPISYMIMMLVDNKHLFMFKNPPLSDLGAESAFYLADTFYSTDPSQIERVSEMLDDIWKRGIDITEISSQAGTKLPNIEVATNETAAGIVTKMLENNVDSVLITDKNRPVGVINDRDMLRDIVERKRDLTKTLAKDLKFTPLIILENDESMITAMKFMSEKGFKRAAMVKNGQLIGMLTEEAAKKATVQMKATAK